MSRKPSSQEARPTLEGAVRRLVDRAALDLEEHPSTDRWVEYQEGFLDEAEEEELQEHLTQCRICRGIVLSLAEAEKGSEDPEFTELSTPAQWPRAENLAAFPPAVVGRPRGLRHPFTPSTGWLAAAVVSLALFSTYYLHHQEIARLEREVGRISAVAAGRAPEFDLSLYDAFAEELSERGSEVRDRPRLRSGGTLALELPDLRSARNLVLSISQVAQGSLQNTREIWSTTVQSDAGRFAALRVPPRALPPGEYVAELSGLLNSSGQKVLASYRFVVEPTRP